MGAEGSCGTQGPASTTPTPPPRAPIISHATGMSAPGLRYQSKWHGGLHPPPGAWPRRVVPIPTCLHTEANAVHPSAMPAAPLRRTSTHVYIHCQYWLSRAANAPPPPPLCIGICPIPAEFRLCYLPLRPSGGTGQSHRKIGSGSGKQNPLCVCSVCGGLRKDRRISTSRNGVVMNEIV